MIKPLIAYGVVAFALLAAAPAARANPVSQFPITIDGQFTGGLVNGVVQGEWSDLTPQAFIAPQSPTGTLLTTTLNDPLKNSLLYAGLAPETVNGPVTALYLMYAFRDLTPQVFDLNKLIFHVTFPVISQGTPFNVDVRLLGTGIAAPFYTVEVLANGATVPANIVAGSGEIAAAFGPSPLATFPHFLMELEVDLLVQPGFGTPGGPFPPGGLNGVYSTNPASWNASAVNNVTDPPISSAIFTIRPDGTTVVDASNVPQAVPEPSAAMLVLLALAALCLCERRRAGMRKRERLAGDANVVQRSPKVTRRR